MRLLRIAQRRLGISGELLAFFVANKRWWMVPMLFMLLVFGVVLVVAQSSAIGPFIYTLF